MRHRAWERGVSTTELGLGTAQFGNLYQETSDAESAATLDAAWAAGIRSFDTAPHYGLGLAERRLGAALSGRPRDEYVLSTKVGRRLVPNPGGAGLMDDHFVVPAALRREWDFTRDGIRRSLDESLRRMETDHVDILYLHDPDDHEDEALHQALPAMVELREEGLVRAVGVGMNQSAMPARFIERIDIDVVMVAGRYTLLDQSATADLLPTAARHGVAVVAAGIYNSGVLSTHPIRGDAHYDYGSVPASVLERARRIEAVCESHGVSVPEAAIAFPLLHPAVKGVVVGAQTPTQIAETVQRYRATVADELWVALAHQGLIDERIVES